MKIKELIIILSPIRFFFNLIFFFYGYRLYINPLIIYQQFIKKYYQETKE